MQIHRVAPMLQNVAKVRNWVVEHIPLTGSLIGYDLFLKLGNDLATGAPLDLQTIATGMPYPAEAVAQQLGLMIQVGLLIAANSGDGRSVVRPTERFLSLLASYGRQLERLFIVRDDLRQHQLLSAVTDPELAALGKLIYDRMYDLGWLYLHNFGSACFMMASLVRRVAAAHGRQARVASCHVQILGEGTNFLLGAPGMAKPGQIDGHAVCVVDEQVIIDFGLGNVRKGLRRDFAWGAMCDYRRDGRVMGAVAIAGRETMIWKDDWQSPGSEAELANYAPHIEPLFGEYAARFL